MRYVYAIAVSLLLAASLLLSACGSDGDTPKSGGTDEDYLRAICVGTTNFSNALLSKTNPDDIAKVIRDFIAVMKKANPPADLANYNKEFVQYLEDAVSEPTSLVTRKPPLPSKDVQRRIASLEPTIDECKSGTFFSRSVQ